ncbi:DUF1330 domain-containing protein [Thalassolituus sp. C2-1]|uniref:DUF1330 domain-containing protein n=1 Tax=Venatorbacter sp. C2-1 TaxID=2597518 RepID=UPI00119745B4|nr:DUF1330 domain-containing protein [Thalassolituus sp. C2-1]TVV42835.1 DUF1330 domain-containing protein [Thalassolituus sp. C2-1]
MGYERVMGLHVTDDVGYQQYRDAMLPILTAYGGSFGYDFRIAEVLKTKTANHINRVFTIEFPDQKTMEAFFADPEYLAIKSRHLDHSVASRTIIAMYNNATEL